MGEQLGDADRRELRLASLAKLAHPLHHSWGERNRWKWRGGGQITRKKKRYRVWVANIPFDK